MFLGDGGSEGSAIGAGGTTTRSSTFGVGTHNGDIAEKSETSSGAGAAMAGSGDEVHSAHVMLGDRDIGVPKKSLCADTVPRLGEDLAESRHAGSMSTMDAAGTRARRSMDRWRLLVALSRYMC